jgi:SHS family lactate transporter-like MFS transporter
VIFGLVSDRVGRRRAIVLSLLCALTVIPIWAFAPSLAVLVVGAFLMQFFVQGAWGVIPAHITELSPDAVRGSLPGVAYQIGIASASSIAYLEAATAAHASYAWAMALTAGIVFSAAALIAAVGPERRGIVYGAEARDSPLP